ncbi:MAG: putative transcriptional regulator YvhJ [Bacilli bacterium]|nr:putative transcriptional regulator YvhJ [Bacilli bacterium]
MKTRSQKRTRKLKKGRVLLAAIVLFVLAFIAMIGPKNITSFIMNPKSAPKLVQSNLGQAISGNTGPINVLLIGNNARDATSALSLGTAAGQADILIVAHIDPGTHQVSFISIPRDTLIAMPDWQEPIPKIKSTFELGLQQGADQGPQLAMQYVSKLTGLDIHYYVASYFQGFADAVDAVGGIQVNIQERLYDPDHSGADLQPGLQTLNGQQTLAYIRIRQNAAGNNYRTDDFQRQNAEIEVLDILKQKLLSSGSSLGELGKLQAAWQKDVATNIPSSMLLGLGLEVSGSHLDQIMLGSVNDSMDIVDAPVPGVNKEGYLSGAYYDVLDPKEIQQKLQAFGSTHASTGLPPLPDPNSVVVNLYGSQTTADQLQKAGFNVHLLGNDPGNGQVEVFYPQGKLMAACAVARVLGTANELIEPARSASVVTVYFPSS